jgi:hypothetical protein
MKTYGGMEVLLHHFWFGQQLEVTGQVYPPAALPPEEKPAVSIV